MSTAPPVVLESNASGSPFTFDALWLGRQERARQQLAEAAIRAAKLLAEAADSPTMMIRVAAIETLALSDIFPNKLIYQSMHPFLFESRSVIDGVSINKGDMVLLTKQTEATENGVWIVPNRGEVIQRPSGYLNAPGRQFFVTEGVTGNGTLFVCTTAD